MVELNADGCWVGQPECELIFDSLECVGDMTVTEESESCRDGTAVLAEFSDENKLDPLVCDDATDFMLPPSNDLLCPDPE